MIQCLRHKHFARRMCYEKPQHRSPTITRLTRAQHQAGSWSLYSGSQAISEAAMNGTGGEKTSAMPEGPQSKSCKWHIRIQRPASTNMQSLVQNSQHVMTMQPIKRHVITRGAKNTPLHPFPDREHQLDTTCLVRTYDGHFSRESQCTVNKDRLKGTVGHYKMEMMTVNKWPLTTQPTDMAHWQQCTGQSPNVVAKLHHKFFVFFSASVEDSATFLLTLLK